ncbi:MAG: hypothetical protein V1776_02355 [Candidatus Diapherotrites archaeon]
MVRKVVKRVVERFRRPRFSGDLPRGGGVQDGIRDVLLIERRIRAKGVKRMAKIAAPLSFGAFALSTFISNPSFREGLARVVAVSLGLTGYGAVLPYSFGSSFVRKATQEVGKRLGQESMHNTELKAFLGKYKYVYVDRKGRIAGTNMPRLIPGVGRIRLQSNKILAGAY